MPRSAATMESLGAVVREASRFRRPSLRQATVIVPATGERLKKAVTLRDRGSPVDSRNGNGSGIPGLDGTSPLLPINKITNHSRSKLQRAREWVQTRPRKAVSEACVFVTSSNGKAVLKCSIAYLLATCAVFIPSLGTLLGTGDSKHFVANIIVWYSPSRSSGSMEQGTVFALIAFAFSAMLSMVSMGIASASKARDQLIAGHVLILVFACGFGLGFLLWTKQKLNNPLWNVSVSLAALPLVTTVTKDATVQQGFFSFQYLMQMLRMAVLGISITTLICLFLWPVRARKQLRKNIAETTDSFADLVAGITASFLTGTEDDMKHPMVTSASEKLSKNLQSLDGLLTETRNERYIVGKESVFLVEKRLVDCIHELAQDIGGLRSAAAMQFALLAESADQGNPTIQPPTKLSTLLPQSMESSFLTETDGSPVLLRDNEQERVLSSSPPTGAPPLSAMYGALATNDRPEANPGSSSTHTEHLTASAAGIFLTFIERLGPPMKSLAFTLKQILENLPFDSTPRYRVALHPTFRTSLVEALSLYQRSRKEALDAVYHTKEVMEARRVSVAADYEEVAAACGHFSSSLEDIAEHCLTYLDILSELELEDTRSIDKRSWWWLCFWRSHPGLLRPKSIPFRMPSLGVRRHEHLPPAQKSAIRQSLRYRLWRGLHVLRRDDVRYAMKVGGGAAILAMFAFLPATEPFFHHWRLEWALATYIIACSMTIGAANTTTLQRLRGSAAGAALAILVWLATASHPVALALAGWAVAYACFYLILVAKQGPTGRFILLTYNLSVLYSYSLSVNDQDHDEDEGGLDPHIWEITGHRLLAITIGCLWGLFVTRAIWPIVARRKLRSGLALLYLRMGLIWTHGPLSALLARHDRAAEPPEESRLDITTETALRRFAASLDTLRANAESEFMLRGAFPSAAYARVLAATGRILDALHALNVVIVRDAEVTPGESLLLRETAAERRQLAARISHLLGVLAATFQLEYPLNSDALPSILHTRDRLLARIFRFRVEHAGVPEQDYRLLYTYALVTAQVDREIKVVGGEVAGLYGSLSEDLLKLE